MNPTALPCPSRAAAAALLLAAACSSSGPVAPTVLEHGSMSARIDGAAWSASAALVASYSNGILTFAGTDGSARTIAIALIPSAGPATYTMGNLEPTNASLTAGGAAWQSAATIGSGTVTLTTISSTAATGTFAFNGVAVPNTQATGTKPVTQGTFDLTF